MKRVPVFEAKNRLSELLAMAERGEEVAITRRGVAVARLVAIQPDTGDDAERRQAVRDAFASLRCLREAIDIDGDLKAIARAGLD